MTEPERIARLRALCLRLPEAVEKLSHGEPNWFAGKGKVFASLDNHHHGAAHLSVWLPLPPGMQAMLIDEAPEVFFRPPYVGHRGWVGVILDDHTHWEALERLVRLAFTHVATRRLAALVGAEP